MSVLIRGMKMPKTCWDCEFFNTEICPCKGYATALKHVTDRHDHCPLIAVPDHGRLIDADAFLAKLKKDPLFPLVEKYGMSGVIEAQPTIIPAEEVGQDA